MRTQFTARLPEPLAAALAERAQANHRSANAELTAILSGALSGAPATPATAPYKAALQRLIDDSAALREKYEDLDAAVEQAQKLLHT